MSSKQTRWPQNHIDQKTDQIALLLTFFKKQIVKVNKLLPNVKIKNESTILLKLKSYDMTQLFYKFKNASPQARDFNYYNASLDDQNSTKGLDIFKTYLLSLRVPGSKMTVDDLKDVKFKKVSHSTETKTATATLTWTYEDLSVAKTVTDFRYQSAYKLSLKSGIASKMADEVKSTDIVTDNLPSGVTIDNMAPSTDRIDGTVIKITFNGGTIPSQELADLTSYQFKATKILSSTSGNVFSGISQPNTLPSEYNNKKSILDILKAQANIISDPAQNKVKKILEIANIKFISNDQTGILQFQITISKTSKIFAISGFDNINSIYQVNKRIDAEVARKKMPTIKPGSEWKIVPKFKKEDIKIILYDKNLIAKVINIKSKKTGKYILSHDDTTAIVTIEISSSVSGTKKTTYQVELKGFAHSLSAPYFSRVLNKTNNNDFKIKNKKMILPSDFKDANLIKNTLKSKISSTLSIRDKELLINNIDNNMKIIFDSDDQKGILKFTVKLGIDSINKTFVISGFKKILNFNN